MRASEHRACLSMSKSGGLKRGRPRSPPPGEPGSIGGAAPFIGIIMLANKSKFAGQDVFHIHTSNHVVSGDSAAIDDGDDRVYCYSAHSVP